MFSNSWIHALLSIATAIVLLLFGLSQWYFSSSPVSFPRQYNKPHMTIGIFLNSKLIILSITHLALLQLVPFTSSIFWCLAKHRAGFLTIFPIQRVFIITMVGLLRSVRVNNVSDLFELGFKGIKRKPASNRRKYIYVAGTLVMVGLATCAKLPDWDI